MARVKLSGGPLDGMSVELIDEPQVGDVVPLPMSSLRSPIYVATSASEARYSPPPPSPAPRQSPPDSSKLE